MMYSNFDKLFNRLFDDYGTSYSYKIVSENPQSQCDVNLVKDGAYLSFEVPGYNKSNLKIELENDKLIIKGERKINSSGQESIKTLSKEFKLGFEIDASTIEATCEDGILTVFVPNYKKRNNINRTIKIS